MGVMETIIELYGVNGELGTLMKTRFTTLCISSEFKNFRETIWKKRTGEMLYTNEMDVARRFVLGGGGQNLRTIIVGAGMYAGDSESKSELESESDGGPDCTGDCEADRENEPNIVDDFLKSCPNVISLSVYDEKGEWASKFGDQLESLEIETDKSSGIIDSCRNLRELNLYAPHAEDLQDIGDKLECLKFHSSDDDDHSDSATLFRSTWDMEAIAKYCRNLRSFTFNDAADYENTWNDAISSLLASYGDQLEYCEVKNMYDDDLTTITSACKNVRFHVSVSNDEENIYPTLKVLGSQLDKIEVDLSSDGDESPDYYSDLRNAWNECVNVRELDAMNCNIEHAKAIMAVPKEHLTKLYICPVWAMEEEEVKKLLDIFSEGTVAVEEFVYHGHRSRPCVDAMEKFVARNRSSLREFSIYGNDLEMDAYLPLLLKCPALESVRGFGDECKFDQSMLITLRSRGVACFHNSCHPSYS